MKNFSGFTRSFLLASIILTIGAQCLAQVTRVNADDLMDVVFDMKKAAATADRRLRDSYLGLALQFERLAQVLDKSADPEKAAAGVETSQFPLRPGARRSG